MLRLERILRRYERKLFSMENVVGTGLGYKIVEGRTTNEPAIIVLVKKKKSERELPASQVLPKKLDEVLTDVIEVGEVRFLGARTQKTRPAMPGMSIGHYKVTAGTFGAVVKDEISGEPLILSNNHVLANASNGKDGRAAIGDPILQPGPYDGGGTEDVIAHLYRFVPVERDVAHSRCSIARRGENIINFFLRIIKPDYRVAFMKQKTAYNLVDAAVAKPVNPDYITSEILDLGEIRGIAEPSIGMVLIKSGRTSGVSKSEIKALSVTIRVLMGQGEEATFHEQILAGPMAQPGDSGSLVLNEKMEAVGLLFAGSELATLINPINLVMKLLKVTF
ncbi:MAG: S1 family peptidase [Thermosediminibacteraceae bacterium]|nr:S1 family peptidase [Thermosediminibacteraceae bacterium]